MRNRWFHAPELHTHGADFEKRAGWLELFYDLIFVAAFIQLGNGLIQKDVPLDLGRFLAFCAIFVPIWLAWTGFTYYANRFNVDDFIHRVLVFFQMFAVGAMAVYASDVFNHQPHRFAAAFAVAQAVVAALYYRSYKHSAEARDYSLYWGGVFAVGAVVWALSTLCPEPWCYVLWGLGVGAIISAPFHRFSRALMERYPIDQEHLSERYGLLTIIVLGESFVKVLSALGPEASGAVLGQAALTLLITCSIWWVYFDDVAGAELKKGPLVPMIWLFAHIPLQLGITATGIGIKKAAFWDPGVPALAKYRWLLCGALALALVGVACIDSVSRRKHAELSDRARVNMRLGSAMLIVLVAAVGGAMNGWLFLTIVTAACVAQVVFDMMMAPEAEDEHGEHGMRTTAELAREAAHRGVATPRPDIDQLDRVVRKGAPNELRRDMYYYLMEGSWLRVVVTLAFLYLVSNIFFAALYMLQPGSIANADSLSFPDAFFFSVQTMSTIGYGSLHPATDYGDLIVTLEAAVGLFGVALATGLMFAKASRPRASVLFSEVAVITEYAGRPTLMFRAGNARGSEIVDARMNVTVLREELTPEGHHMRRLHDLELTRAHSPLFTMTWSVMHVIDASSPLADVDWSAPENSVMSVVCILTGHDGTYGSTVFARHIYAPEMIRPAHRFVDVISQTEDGRMMIDYEKFHDVVPSSPAEA